MGSGRLRIAREDGRKRPDVLRGLWRNPSLGRVMMGFADQIGQESDLIALPILQIIVMESVV
jgi:hypothetical protein